MTNQKVEQLLSLNLEKNSKIWVHPYTGVLIYYKNDSKITIHNKIALVDQLPPDFIIELPFGQIECVSFQNKIFIIAFDSGELAIVNNQSYTVILLKKIFKKTVSNLSISTDGNLLLVYTEDNKIFIIDITKDKEIKELKLKDEVLTCSVWLTDTKFVYTTDTGSIHYYDLTKGKEIKIIKEAHHSKITTLDKNPRNMYTIITGDQLGEIKIWDLDENKIHPDLVNSFTDLKSEISFLTSSQNGENFISIDDKGILRIFDVRFTRNEKQLVFIPISERISSIIMTFQPGEFLIVHKNGSIILFQGFSTEQILLEFQTFQTEVESFSKRIEQLPDWLINDTLEFIIPNEVPIIEKNLDLATKILHPSLLEKNTSSSWMQANFRELFKKPLVLKEKIEQTILKTRVKIQEKKAEIEKGSQFSKKLEEELVQYFATMKPGKISLDQVSLYFNVNTETILPILQHLEQEKLVNGVLKSEYSGYFFELHAPKDDFDSSKHNSKELEIITCHNCGTDYDISKKTCPNCHTDSILCESCQKYIQQRQMLITCPHCKSFFHLACFESKVKIFGRCPKCRELVDFDSLIRKSVSEQKQQDKIVSGLTKLISKKNKFVKESESDDSDDSLFDF